MQSLDDRPSHIAPSSLVSAVTRRSLMGLTSALLALGLLGACAGGAAPANVEARASNRQAALAAAVGMPEPSSHTALDFNWIDVNRGREVLARLYLPAGLAQRADRIPLVVFSHGIGGSREGYTYIGKYLAANGFAVMHVQHVGSDRRLWAGNPLQMADRLRDAAKEGEAIDRTKDLSFAIDQIMADRTVAPLIDFQRIAAAGHSYGANTALLLSGAQVTRDGRTIDLADLRIKAAVIISAPPFYGEGDPAGIVGSIKVPSLHITATADEIKIPGYYSGAQDRLAVYEAAGPQNNKMLAVFKDGSHSMFTDRLGTGGEAFNPQVKKATRELMLAFLHQQFGGSSQALHEWPTQYQALLARFEQKR